MFNFMESRKDGTAHGKLDGLLDVMLLRQEDGTVLVSTVRFFDGELNIQDCCLHLLYI